MSSLAWQFSKPECLSWDMQGEPAIGAVEREKSCSSGVAAAVALFPVVPSPEISGARKCQAVLRLATQQL